MCGVARIFAHPDFRSWLQADYPATSPVRPLNPQLRTWEAPPANVSVWLRSEVPAMSGVRPLIPQQETFAQRRDRGSS